MTFQEFDDFQKKLFDECIQMRDTKGLEYTSGKDRFENFNDEAIDMDVPRLKVAEIFLNKHMRAIKSFIRTGKSHSTESIHGRFIDAIVYLTLIAGMVEEDKKDLCKACGKPLEKHFWWKNRTKYKPGELLACIMVDEMDNAKPLEDQNLGKHQPFEFDPTFKPTAGAYKCLHCNFESDSLDRIQEHNIEMHNYAKNP